MFKKGSLADRKGRLGEEIVDIRIKDNILKDSLGYTVTNQRPLFDTNKPHRYDKCLEVREHPGEIAIDVKCYDVMSKSRYRGWISVSQSDYRSYEGIAAMKPFYIFFACRLSGSIRALLLGDLDPIVGPQGRGGAMWMFPFAQLIFIDDLTWHERVELDRLTDKNSPHYIPLPKMPPQTELQLAM